MLMNRERALAVMERAGLDALIATTPENVYYLTDYAREPPFLSGRDHNWAIFPRDESLPAVLLLNEFELPSHVQRPSWVQEIVVQTGADTVLPPADSLPEPERSVRELMAAGRERGGTDRVALLVDALERRGLAGGRLGFDEPSVRDSLAERLPDAERVDALNALREIRVVKTAEEIALLRRSAALLQTSFEAVVNKLGVGITTRELISTFRQAMEAQGGWGSHMTYGGGTAPWVGFPDTSYRLKEGDILFVDPAGTYRHYWSDLGRSAHIGEPSGKFQELWGTLQECHRAVVPAMVPGATFAGLADIARETVGSAIPHGFMPLFHSMGIEQYDHPQERGAFGGGGLELEAGMVINFESLYFELGFGVLQLEDTYLIGTGGPEQLTTLTKDPVVA
jgi:Xaa-Pro dipeptidase